MLSFSWNRDVTFWGLWRPWTLPARGVNDWAALAFYRKSLPTSCSLSLEGQWLQHQNHTWPFPHECKREKEKDKGWGSAPTRKPPDEAALFQNHTFWKDWLAENWVRLSSHTQVLLCSTLRSQHWGIRGISSFLLSQDISITEQQWVPPLFRKKLTTVESCFVDLTNH